MTSHRRTFLKTAAGAVSLPALLSAQGRVQRKAGTRLKLALNAYSFNKPLRDGSMTLFDVVDYCAEHGIDALDATGYYFPGYPKAAPDEYLYKLKRRAFVNGVVINGTGVRNDFAVTDPARRTADVQLVKDWIVVAQKLGATVVRVFAGAKVPEGHTFDQALAWMTPLFKECAAYGRDRGVIVGLQNHNDFVKTAAETVRIVNAIDSEWFGVILDVGSLRQGDPYAEIEALVPYAVSWQLKEMVWPDGKEAPTNLERVKAAIERSGYRGFLPIETLGEGDPRVKVADFVKRIRAVFAV